MGVQPKRILLISVLVAAPILLGFAAHRRQQALIEGHIRVLMSDDAEAAEAARQIVQRMGKRAVKPLVRELYNTPTGKVEDRLARALANIGDVRAPRALWDAAREGSIVAAECLRTLRHPRAGKALALAQYARANQLMHRALSQVHVARSVEEARASAKPPSGGPGWRADDCLWEATSLYSQAWEQGGLRAAAEAALTYAAKTSGPNHWWYVADWARADEEELSPAAKAFDERRRLLDSLWKAAAALLPQGYLVWEALDFGTSLSGGRLWVAAAVAQPG
ncbi:MAG: hypothetical protein ACE5R4_05625 [Armatimonadota bacterium]